MIMKKNVLNMNDEGFFIRLVEESIGNGDSAVLEAGLALALNEKGLSW